MVLPKPIRPLENLIDSVEELQKLVEGFCQRAQQEGLDIQSGSSKTWEHIKSLKVSKQQSIYKSFAAFYKVYYDSLSQGSPLTDTKSTIWALFKETGWRPASDLFDKIGPHDVVEVYGSDLKQIFRNLKFFDFTSYTLADLFAYEFSELFKRDHFILLRLLKLVPDFLLGRIKGTIPLEIGWHTIEESFSKQKHKIRVNHKYVSPVFDRSNKLVGAVVISEAELLSEKDRFRPLFVLTETKERNINGS